MAEKIGLEAVFETSKFSQAMKAYFENIKTAEDVTDNLADALTRLGYDFSDLEGNVGRMAQRMRASTPENLKFAQSYERIVKEFKDGKITSQQAADQLDKLQREMKETGGASNKAQGGVKLFWTELNSMIGVAKQVIGAIANTAKEIYNFGKAGAEIEWMETKFERLSISIGSTGDAMEQGLMLAMDGLISKSDAMSVATDIVSLGLVKTQTQAIRLTEAVVKLGADMNQVVLALTNRTTARFDQIGISTDGFKERLASLEKQGYSTEEAFTEAFLQQAEAQLEKVGSIAEETIGSYMRLEASAKDYLNTLKEVVGIGLAPTADRLTSIINLHNKVTEAVDAEIISTFKANAILRKGVLSMEAAEDALKDLNERTVAATVITDAHTKSREDVIKATVESAVESSNLRKEIIKQTEAEVEQKKATSALSEAYELGIISQHDYAITMALLEAGLIDLEDATTINEESVYDLIDAQKQQIEAEEELELQTKKAKEEQEKLAAATQAAKDAANQARIAFYDLAEQLSEGLDKSGTYKLQVAQLGKLLEDEKITIEEYNAAVEAMGVAYGQLTPKGMALAKAWEIFNQLVALGIVDMEEYDEAFKAMEETADDGVVTMKEVIEAIIDVGAEADNSSEAYGTAADRMNKIDLGEAIAQEGGLANYLNQIASIPANQTKFIDVYTTNYTRTVALSSREQQYGFGEWSERASGGDVSAGTPYIVGEQRPEVFVPGSDGYIFPSVQAFQNALARAGGSTVNNNTSNFNMNIGSMNANQSTVERSFAMMQLLAR